MLQDHPEPFKDAFFDFASIKMYSNSAVSAAIPNAVKRDEPSSGVATVTTSVVVHETTTLGRPSTVTGGGIYSDSYSLGWEPLTTITAVFHSHGHAHGTGHSRLVHTHRHSHKSLSPVDTGFRAVSSKINSQTTTFEAPTTSLISQSTSADATTSGTQGSVYSGAVQASCIAMIVGLVVAFALL